MDTYYDSAEDMSITRDRARDLICLEHGLPGEYWDRFLAEVGDWPVYDNAQVVLDWLGY